jgi:RNA 3'-terminal phosphate cyclase (ATP)
MIQIDGCQGEGGGQILRTSLALSLVTGKPFHITRIRAGRGKPGLLPQHLTAVNAAAAIGQAKVDGGELGSLELTFTPQEVRPGEYRFSVGTAGSATLVLQTVLPPLLFASGPSRLTLSGGTHNTHAPPFDFLANAFAPLLARLASPADPVALLTPGGETAAKPLEVQLVRPGFYPAGGGEFTATITPPAGWRGLELLERGAAQTRIARAIVAHLPRDIAQRELRVVQRELAWPQQSLRTEEARGTPGPGNVLMLEMGYERVTELVTSFGTRGAPAEAVATDAVAQARRYLRSDAPVGPHLADQILLPMALGGGGTFRTAVLTPHAVTNIEIIRAFLDVAIETTQEAKGDWRVTVRRGGNSDLS